MLKWNTTIEHIIRHKKSPSKPILQGGCFISTGNMPQLWDCYFIWFPIQYQIFNFQFISVPGLHTFQVIVVQKLSKQIGRYLKVTHDKGLVFSWTSDFNLDCFVDEDFEGLYHYEDYQDPVSVKSKTVYFTLLSGCTVVWVSKLHR